MAMSDSNLLQFIELIASDTGKDVVIRWSPENKRWSAEVGAFRSAHPSSPKKAVTEALRQLRQYKDQKRQREAEEENAKAPDNIR
jgi:hypothetical protein